MIKFAKSGKYSIELRFDLDGAQYLLAAFQSASSFGMSTIDTEISVGLSNRPIIVNQLIISRAKTQSILKHSSSEVTMQLDSDDLETGVERLKECVDKKTFYPAEFIEISLQKEDRKAYLYGVFCE